MNAQAYGLGPGHPDWVVLVGMLIAYPITLPGVLIVIFIFTFSGVLPHSSYAHSWYL